MTQDKTDARADTILKNIFLIQNVTGQVPYGEDGHRDWYYKGPNNDREWAWLSNRHSQLHHVFLIYMKTGNPRYAKYIDQFLRDFIIKSMPYPAEKRSTSIWRGLEVAGRAKHWASIFYGLVNSEYLLPSTKLLMLSSIPDHAHYNRNFHAGSNWLTKENSGSLSTRLKPISPGKLKRFGTGIPTARWKYMTMELLTPRTKRKPENYSGH